MMKKIITCFISIMLAVSMITTAVAAADFSDTQSSDFKDSISLLHNIGIVNGYEDGSFQPDNTITRAEFVTRAEAAAVIYNLLQIQ